MFVQICLYFAIIAGVSFLIWYTVGSAHCHDIIEYLEAPQEETTEDMLFYDYHSGLIFKANPEELRLLINFEPIVPQRKVSNMTRVSCYMGIKSGMDEFLEIVKEA